MCVYIHVYHGNCLAALCNVTGKRTANHAPVHWGMRQGRRACAGYEYAAYAPGILGMRQVRRICAAYAWYALDTLFINTTSSEIAQKKKAHGHLPTISNICCTLRVILDKNKVTAPLTGRAFNHIFLIGLVWRMRETGPICAFRSSKAVKRVREVLEAARTFSDFCVLPCV